MRAATDGAVTVRAISWTFRSSDSFRPRDDRVNQLCNHTVPMPEKPAGAAGSRSARRAATVYERRAIRGRGLRDEHPHALLLVERPDAPNVIGGVALGLARDH